MFGSWSRSLNNQGSNLGSNWGYNQPSRNYQSGLYRPRGYFQRPSSSSWTSYFRPQQQNYRPQFNPNMWQSYFRNWQPPQQQQPPEQPQQPEQPQEPQQPQAPLANVNDQISSAVPVSTVTHGYIHESGFGINRGETKNFLIDPRTYALGWKPNYNGLRVELRDANQSHSVNVGPRENGSSGTNLLKLNSRNEVVGRYPLQGSGDLSVHVPNLTQDEYNSGVKYMLQVQEGGMGSQPGGLKVMWLYT